MYKPLLDGGLNVSLFLCHERERERCVGARALDECVSVWQAPPTENTLNMIHVHAL